MAVECPLPLLLLQHAHSCVCMCTHTQREAFTLHCNCPLNSSRHCASSWWPSLETVLPGEKGHLLDESPQLVVDRRPDLLGLPCALSEGHASLLSLARVASPQVTCLSDLGPSPPVARSASAPVCTEVRVHGCVALEWRDRTFCSPSTGDKIFLELKPGNPFRPARWYPLRC